MSKGNIVENKFKFTKKTFLEQVEVLEKKNFFWEQTTSNT